MTGVIYESLPLLLAPALFTQMERREESWTKKKENKKKTVTDTVRSRGTKMIPQSHV